MPKSVDVTTTAESTAAASTGTDDDVAVGEATAAAPKANEPRKLNSAGIPISMAASDRWRLTNSLMFALVAAATGFEDSVRFVAAAWMSAGVHF